MKIKFFLSGFIVLALGLFIFYRLYPTPPIQYFINAPNGKKYEIQMIDPVVFDSSNLSAIKEFFMQNGYVVVDNVSEKGQRDELVQLIDQIIDKKIQCARRVGFLDLYHDNALAQLRQNPLLYKVFTSIFNTDKLWVVFDRVIYQNANEGDEPLNPHVDQNPIENPDFFNVQAMLALRDMNEYTGTLALVPKSPAFFHEYTQWIKPKAGYVEYQEGRILPFIGLRLKAGQLVIWDSRTTHSRFRAEGKFNRYAALLTFTTAKNNQELVGLRMKYFNEGIGWNNHEAGLRATAKPRCDISLRKTAEKLTPLGRKLYGLDSWF